MDYEHAINDVAIQMAASQLSRYPRYSFGSTSRRRSGRVEKARSSHTSPAFREKRAQSIARSNQPSLYQYPSYDGYHVPSQRSSRPARPFSWHSTSSHQIMPYYASQMTSPAASSYIQTPVLQPTMMNSIANQNCQPLFQDNSMLQKSYQTTPLITNSPDYYLEPYVSHSPEMDYYYDGQTPVVHNNVPTSNSSTYSNSWYPTSYSHQISPMALYSSKPATHLSTYNTQVHLPSMVLPQEEAIYSDDDVSPPAQEVIKELDIPSPEVEEEGEVLVALGLYDLPNDTAAATSTSFSKLLETWQPPVEEDDDQDADAEAEDDEEEEPIKTPDAGTSWFI